MLTLDKGEKRDERTNKLCSYTIDIYRRLELGAGWYLWF